MDEQKDLHAALAALLDPRKRFRYDDDQSRLPAAISDWVEDEQASPYRALREMVFVDEPLPARREYVRDLCLPVLPPKAVRFAGPRLYRADLEVAIALWRLKLSAPGEVEVVTNWFLHSLRRAPSEAERAAFEDSIDALTSATIDVSCGRSCVGGHIISGCLQDGDRWFVRMNKDLAQVFAPNFTWPTENIRRAL